MGIINLYFFFYIFKKLVVLECYKLILNVKYKWGKKYLRQEKKVI